MVLLDELGARTVDLRAQEEKESAQKQEDWKSYLYSDVALHVEAMTL